MHCLPAQNNEARTGSTEPSPWHIDTLKKSESAIKQRFNGHNSTRWCTCHYSALSQHAGRRGGKSNWCVSCCTSLTIPAGSLRDSACDSALQLEALMIGRNIFGCADGWNNLAAWRLACLVVRKMICQLGSMVQRSSSGLCKAARENGLLPRIDVVWELVRTSLTLSGPRQQLALLVFFFLKWMGSNLKLKVRTCHKDLLMNSLMVKISVVEDENLVETNQSLGL
jgi:hypothetical protein